MLSEYSKAKANLQDVFNDNTPAQLSVTVDGWSSRVFRSDVVITAHWVDVEWKLRTILLDFVRFPSPHDGASVKNLLESSLSQWNLLSKVTAVTSENGSEMCSGIRLLGDTIGRSDFQVRCIAHLVKIVVKASFAMIHQCILSIRKVVGAIRILVKRRERFDALK